jgi:hypothetical protein
MLFLHPLSSIGNYTPSPETLPTVPQFHSFKHGMLKFEDSYTSAGKTHWKMNGSFTSFVPCMLIVDAIRCITSHGDSSNGCSWGHNRNFIRCSTGGRQVCITVSAFFFVFGHLKLARPSLIFVSLSLVDSISNYAF